ncbi:MAG: hypothetical protein B6241_11900 [Spirochaetaceae bacterium 4572_59]|nr:MAG: hypothetical protein B6241_11900 [Spirochaetaceae bacterium 4572_59]
MKKRIIAVLIMLVSLVLSIQAEVSGEEVIWNVYERETPDDLKGNLTMTLENSRGDQRVRKITQYTKNTKNDEKEIMFFNSPADVKDTSFMNWSFTQEGKEDSQWIYLPALKKVKRISSSGRSDYFMGSDFTYDDLGDRHPTEDTHLILRSEDLKGEKCFVVESIPREEDYMYSRTITWVSEDKWIGLKKEFYDEDGELLKILEIQDIHEFEGFWIIRSSRMQNIQKNHKTNMELSNIEINTGLQDRVFTERIMMRGL